MLRNLLLLCLGIALSNDRLNAQELISWHDDLTQARQISHQYKVPILIHFYGDNCMPCKTLEKNVFTRPEVASTMQRYFVPVHINATQDRRTAAQYGVHSWPTDVFVSPDGKVLTQGVCNQNPNTYLQNLQSVAVMNRDRNLMLAGNPPPNAPNAQPGSPAASAANAPVHSANRSPANFPVSAAAPAAQTANPYAAPPANNQLQQTPPGNAAAYQGSPAAPYGRLATTSLQQDAPGRDQAPAPYTNPSSGPSPYASTAPVSGLATTSQSALPSPTWSGQSTHGQATSGLVGAGPLPGASSMTVAPAMPGTSQHHKDTNLPQSAQWQPGSAPAPTAGPHLPAKFAGTTSPALSAAPTIPTAAAAARPLASGSFAMSGASAAHGAVVENPHFSEQEKTEGAAGGFSATGSHTQQVPVSRGPSAQLASAGAAAEQMTSAGQPTPASIPALSGYCPVALLSTSAWVEGQPEHAIRHRGRVYFLSSAEAAQKFLAAPDHFCPVLSGYDPLILLRDGTLVEGSVYAGLKDATQNRILLFSSPENKKYFQDNYDRLATELDSLLKPAEPRTAAAPANTLSR